MLFLVNIPYRESKNRTKRFFVEYQIQADHINEALELAKKKFNSYENYNFASWERFMFEEDIEIAPLLNGSVFKLESYQDFIPLYPQFNEEEKIFFNDQLSQIPKSDKCFLYYDFLEKESSPRVRSFLIALMGKNECFASCEKLVTYLQDSDSRVRANTIETLELSGDKDLIPHFMSLLADENNRVRANAIKALWKLGEKNLESHIIKMLGSYNSMMKASALYVLGEVDFPGAIDHILVHLRDEDELVRFNAGRSLNKVIRFEDLKKLIPYLLDTDEIARLYVRKCFMKFEKESAEVLSGSRIEVKDYPWQEASEILRDLGEERLKSGDYSGYMKILIKRMLHHFHI